MPDAIGRAKLDPATAAEALQDREDFEACVAHAHAHAAGDVEGLFGPASVSWTLYREPSTLLFGLPAVLLQLAHPAVAAGVDEHSDFRTDVRGRARRTTGALYRLTFGALSDALAVGRRLHAIHTQVRGQVEAPGATDEGRAYRANDQRLLQWVAATTAVSARATFETFVRPFTREEAARWYPEVVLGSVAVGVRPEVQPATAEGFAGWYEEVLASDALWVGPRARSLVGSLMRSPLAGGALGAVLTAGLLPERLRAAYGLAWGRWEAGMFRAAAASLRGATQAAREPYRYVVAWHEAEARLAAARGLPAGRWSRWVSELGQRVALPTSLGGRGRAGGGRGGVHDNRPGG